jgi:signal transduction histidine kinase/CheY-like chemotaxis protein
MSESLDIHLDQISKLISDLRNSDIDIDKLSELDKSLELLSHTIKTSHLDNYSDEYDTYNGEIRQDAVFYFDKNYRVVRIIGSPGNIFGTADKNGQVPLVSSFFTKDDFKYFSERTKMLLKSYTPQIFDSKIISTNGLLLPVRFRLEKLSFDSGREMIAAGMDFYHQSPAELWDYQKILLENLPGIDVYLFDNNFTHVLAGGREKKKLNLTNADFTGKTLFEVFDEKTRKRLYPFYKNALDGKVSEGEVRIKEHIYSVSSSPVYGINKEVVGGALISQDVSKEKEVERNLIKAKKDAEASDKAKSAFMANMSHEIRTPLNAIIGFTGLLSKTEMTPKQKKFNKLINQSGEHLLSVVNEILLLFKLGLGKVYIEKVPFNTKELIHNIHESLSFRADEKKLKFITDMCDRVPEIIIGDPFRIKQILINLISNAIKYTAEGKVSLSVRCERETKKKVFLRFDVEDTGIGISKDNLDIIFQEFVQSSPKNENNRNGIGLGLTIVRKLVNLMNGRLHVESESNKGSKFSVVIPFEKVQNRKEHLPRKEYKIEYNLLKGKRILFADDDENNILLGESILNEWKTEYELAYDGQEALNLLKNKKFDIALLDIQMPEMSGTEVIRKIRRQKENPNQDTPILAVTANVMDSDIKNYIKSGFDDFVLKPFSEDMLYNKICHLLNMNYKPQNQDKSQSSDDENNEQSQLFDTSMLLKTAGNDIAFFNKMIDTFTDNAKETSECFCRLEEEGNWEEIAKKAHKAIPSFRYFKLNTLVTGLVRLENMGLRDKNYNGMGALTREISGEINKVIDMAQQHKIRDK